MYVILGASGNTGSIAAEKLLAAGKKVRVVGRHMDQLAKLAAKGADVASGDVTQPPMMKQVFRGAEAAYVLMPPNVTSTDVRQYQNEATSAILEGLEDSGVTHVVTLSSVGADKIDKTGPVVGLHLLEKRLAEIPELNVLSLRAGYFMENTLPQIGLIKSFGMMAGPVANDLQIPMIASRDIGTFAAEALLKLDFSGQQAQELLGERDLAYSEAAKIIGMAIGKPDLAYVQLPADQVMQGMTQMGMSKNMAALICEMSESLNNGHMRPLETRTAANTTPTSFEQFVREVFAPAYKGQAKGA